MKKSVIVGLLVILSFSYFVSAVEITQEVTAFVLPEIAQVKINEFVTDPQTNWDGVGSNPSQNDEWIELFNNESEAVNLTGWNISLIDGTNRAYILSEIISSDDYVVIVDPAGTGSQSDDGQIILYDNFGREVDSVSYGNWNDGNINDNTPDGTADDENNECLSRIPNGIDTNNDSADFVKNRCTFNSTNLINFIPVTILNNALFDTCIFESEDVVVSAVVNGSIEEVILSLNLNGLWINISLGNNGEGIYSYTINSSEITENTTIFWQFIVRDVAGNLNFGDLLDTNINSLTVLLIDSPPDGLNNWYVTEPQFALVKDDDAIKTFYRWDAGSVSTYLLPFGLENAPNNANVTGGIQEMNYWSNFSCGVEEEQTSIFMFDFSDLRIEDETPENGSNVFDNSPEVSAYINELHGGNSGVNLDSIIFMVDNAIKIPNITQPNSLDAKISYEEENLSLGEHNISISVRDKAGRLTEGSWQFTIIEQQEFTLTLNAPLPGLYTDRRLPFNLSLTEEGEIEFINYNDRTPRWRRLCRNCDNYGEERARTRSVNEGMNNISFRGTNGITNDTENVLLTVDSKDPSIKKTEPSSGFTNGSFMIEFEEENPASLFLNYGNSFRNAEADLNSCVEDGNKKVCEINVNISDFENQEIRYWFNLTDISGNFDVSRIREVDVDTVSPFVDFFNHTIDGRRVSFVINVTETNFDKITYIDFEDDNPRERNLCTRLRDGVCEKRQTFNRRDHDLTIRAYDEAGNTALVVENLVFDVN